MRFHALSLFIKLIMKILLLFGLFPKEHKDQIINNSRGAIQYAADAFQWSFVKGLTHYYHNISLINLPFIRPFPKFNSIKKENSYEFTFYDNPDLNKGKNIGFNNVLGLRSISRYWNTKKALLKWNSETHGEKIILIYSVNIPFLSAAIKIKKKTKNEKLKICLIVPDIPIYMSDLPKKIHTKLLIRLQNFLLKKLYPNVDKYVLITENMKDLIPINDKPYIIIEGMYNFELNTDFLNDYFLKEYKIVFYGGTLARRYGVLNLVNAFTKLNNNNYRLIICGDGDSKEEICRISELDNRIIYKGQLPREDVLKLIQKSDLLVNPRTPQGEFTKYSFPSKILEYIGSGIPTLIYKLEGIPQEYYNYCFTIEDANIEALTNKINEILSMSKLDLQRIGQKAKEFIEKEKNPIKQCEKLVQLIENN